MSSPLITKPTYLKTILFLQVVSCLFFSYDITADIVAHIEQDNAYSNAEIIHTIFELVAVIALLLGSVSLWTLLNRYIQINAQASETIEMQKGHFDEVALARFNAWELSKAEKEVATLILRGLSLKDIASCRSVSIGTVKSQTSSIFKKTNTENRAAFLGLFIDEFVDDRLNQSH